MRTHIHCATLLVLWMGLLADFSLPAADSTSTTTTNAPLPRADASGNPLRRAPTGHISNYDEAKVGNYTLPDPLVLANGKPVNDARTWFKVRRPELLKLYAEDIFGAIPANAPRTSFKVIETDTGALGGLAIHKDIQMQFGKATNAPVAHLHMYLPSNATGPVPVLLHMVFFSNPPFPDKTTNMVQATSPPRSRLSEAGPITNIFAHGYGYATFRYTDVQPDNSNTFRSGVIAQTLAPGQAKPSPDGWGAISAWAWGASRALDYLEKDRSVDARHVALIGHSRLGKTVLVAGARDPRFALIYSSCAGEMGSSLARRDYGETVDDMAANFPWQFAGNFQKYAGHWNDMPVDTHMIIALNAPHPVFITGGTQDQWADPRGEFLGEVAAGPVYRLVGRQDLGTTSDPPLDTPLITGELGFHYHTGGHAITASDWDAFLEFADKYFRPGNSKRNP